jgi:multicomponent Na+:H+ antiporter subunit D
MISSLLNVAYLIPVAVGGFLPAQSKDRSGSGGSWQIEEAPMYCVVPLCFTALACIVLFFYADALHAFLEPLGRGGMQ